MLIQWLEKSPPNQFPEDIFLCHVNPLDNLTDFTEAESETQHVHRTPSKTIEASVNDISASLTLIDQSNIPSPT